jgi:hypothetical protein
MMPLSKTCSKLINFFMLTGNSTTTTAPNTTSFITHDPQTPTTTTVYVIGK